VSCPQRLCIIIVSVFLVLLVTAPFISNVPVKAYTPKAAGTAFFGGEQDDVTYSIAQTADGGYVLAGYTKSYGAGGSDIWLIKTTSYSFPLGNVPYYTTQWNRTYGGPQDDGAKCVIQTGDGGYALAGYTNSSGAGGYDMWLVKTDVNGTMQWNVTYGGPQDDMANSIIQTSDGGYILAGYTSVLDAQSRSTWLVKTDPTGNVEWNGTYPGQGANSMIQTDDGGYALALEYSYAFGLAKINSTGQLQWNQTYVGPSDMATSESVFQTNDGGYAIAGWTNNSGTGFYGAWLVKTDASGNVEWNKAYAGPGVYSIIQTSDGGYAMAGDRACLILTDSSGNVEWNRNYDGQTGDNVHFARAYSLIQTGPSDFRMTGAQEMLHAETFGMTAWANDGILVRVTLNTDSTPPTITILSPESNKTYAPDSIPLTFYVSNSTVWIGYRLDNGLNVTIAGNTTLPTLPEGQHNITVFASDTSYNAGASDTVYFSSETIYFTITQNAVLETPPPQTTSPTSPTESSEPLPVAGIAVGATLVAAGGVAGLVYFQKSRKIREHQR
jgi:hypothetical protein